MLVDKQEIIHRLVFHISFFSYSLFIRLCGEIIRDGTDQCRAALKRFGSKKHFRQNKDSGLISKKHWKKQIDTLDLKFDELDKDVEAIVRHSRRLWELAKTGYCDDAPDSLDNIYESFSDNDDVDDINEYSVNDLMTSKNSDLHPHASKVRQKRSRSHVFFRGIKSDKRKRRKIERVIRGVSGDLSNNQKQNNREPNLGTLGRKGDRNNTTSRTQSVVNRKKRQNQESMTRSNERSTSLNETSLANRTESNDLIGGRHLDDKGDARETDLFEEDENVSEPPVGWLTEEKLFNELFTSNYSGDSDNTKKVDKSCTIREVCNTLLASYSTDILGSISTLKRLPLLLNSQQLIVDSNAHDIAALVFETLLQIFKDFGSISLQEIIQTRQDMVANHVELLICTMKVLKLNLQDHLVASDGIMYKIFTINSEKSIVQFTTLQLLDVIYSQLLPKAWGDPTSVTSEVYVLLKRLRDSIGSLVHINEIASILLLKRLQCQKWQKSKSNKWFVSSIPSGMSSVYYTGCEDINSTVTIRLRALGRTCPRTEIEAIWALMAFLAGSKSYGSDSSFIWKILPSLFTFQTGVFGKQSDTPLPPSDSQIQRCAKEIKYLSYLLDSCALNPLPSDDTILAKILQRAVHLDSESSSLEKRWSRSDIMTQTIKKHDFKIAESSWRETEITITSDIENCLAKWLLTKYNAESNGDPSLFSLSCDSDILRNCLLLISSWIVQIPNKKARWNRCQEYLSAMMKVLTNSTSSSLNSCTKRKGDDFADLFSASSSHSQSKESTAQLAKRHSSATLLVGIIYTCICEEVRCRSKIPLPLGSISMESLNQVSFSPPVKSICC